MRILSTLSATTNPNPPDVPVFIFKHGERMKLVARPESYEEMVLVVKRKFNLEEHVVPTFVVKTFAVRHGHSIEIDESAYPLVMQYLDEVEVVTTPVVAKVGGHVEATVSFVTETVATETTTSRGKRNDKGKEREKEPVAGTSKPPSRPRISTASEKQRELKATPKKFEPSANDTPMSPPRSHSSVNSAASTLRRSVVVDAAQDPHNLFNENIPVEYVSPAKKRRDYVETDKEDADTPAKAGPSSASASAQVAHTKSQSSEWEHVESPTQTSNRQLEGSQSSKASKPSEKSSQVSGHDSENVKVKKEKASSASTPSGSSSKKGVAEGNQEPSQTQDTTHADTHAAEEIPDVRFKIFIEGPEPAHKAEFMTRSRHPLRKVLTKVCETFGLDHTRAALRLVLEVEHEGEHYEEHYSCSIDDTVGQAGVHANARLRVVMDGEDDDGYEYEDEGEEDES